MGLNTQRIKHTSRLKGKVLPFHPRVNLQANPGSLALTRRPPVRVAGRGLVRAPHDGGSHSSCSTDGEAPVVAGFPGHQDTSRVAEVGAATAPPDGGWENMLAAGKEAG